MFVGVIHHHDDAADAGTASSTSTASATSANPAYVWLQGGQTPPSVTAAISALGDTRWHTVVWCFNDAASISEMETEAERRWGALVQQEGLVFTAHSGQLATLSGFGNARNSKHFECQGAGISPTPPWIWAADAASVDTTLADYGAPREGQVFPNCEGARKDLRLKPDARNTLLFDGIATHTVADDGTVAQERAITMYQTDGSGIADASFLNASTMRILSGFRQGFNAYMKSKFKGFKVVKDGQRVDPGIKATTPNQLRGEAVSYYERHVHAANMEDLEAYKAGLRVERNKSNKDRVDFYHPVNTGNELNTLASAVSFTL